MPRPSPRKRGEGGWCTAFLKQLRQRGRKAVPLVSFSPLAGRRWPAGRMRGVLRPPRSLHRIDIDREVLVVDLLVRPVLADGLQRGVQLLAQVVVVLSHRDADALADEFRIGDGLADQFAAGLAVVV